ncbi:DUF4097 domain-containing protein [Streptomyces sp. LP05-1]|uniref:DUF4097 domain-containing protein n=1 Tax=Streptomyces pyxinae TaxID=2970734 RepID=A0ABT2CLH7_9ACTN|nr:DUF4097 domain-containing protein [Streptomyces sp. LP05-1]MCS0638270.1 DUF4097 domain-containing protein [Streptomyces sp. LP05-1]
MAGRRRGGWVRLVAAGAVVLAVAGVSGCAAGRDDMSEAPVKRQSFPLAGKSLTVDSGDTDVVLVESDVREVEAERQVAAWGLLSGEPEAEWTMRDGTLTLRVRCESAVMGGCAARHQVKVPRGVAVTVKDDNGSVRAEGFASPLTMGSDSGELVVRRARGPLDLRSDSGEIRVEDTTSSRVAARTDSGEVRLALEAAPELVDTASGSGEVAVDLPRGDTRYAVETRSGSGGISVDVPTDRRSSHVVRATTDSGEVSVRGAN